MAISGILMLMISCTCFHLVKSEVRLPPYFINSIPGSLNAPLRLRYPPDRREPKIFYINTNDDEATFPCEAGAVPRADYDWYFRDTHVRDLRQFRVDSVSGTLTMETFGSRTEEGILYCTASNKYGKAVSDKIQIKVSVSNIDSSLPTLTYPVVAGNPLMMPCRGVNIIPTPGYRWSHDDERATAHPDNLPINTRINVMDNGSLWFSHVLASDQEVNKVYKCNAHNSVMDTTSNTVSSNVNVTRRTDSVDFLPVEHVYSRHPSGTALGIEGDRISFKCLFKGGQLSSQNGPAVTWSRKGRDLPLNHVIGRNDELNQLILNNVEMDNEGIYVCTGTQGSSSDEFEVTLTVESRPSFKMAPENTNISDFDTATFSCEPQGVPAPTITWFVNGEPFESVINPRYILSEDKTNFTIREARKNTNSGAFDLMVVQCRIQNIHGYNYTQAYINVLERTKITSPPEQQVISKTESLVYLHCGASSDDATPDITYRWKLDGEFIREVEDRFAFFPNGTLEINVNKTEEEKEELRGRYTCVASNDYSSDSVSVQVSFEGDPDPTEEVVTAGFLEQFWLLILIIGLAILLFLIVLCVVLCWWCNRGDEYPVDEKERAHGLYPEEELFELGFHEYTRLEPASRKESVSSKLMLTETDLDQRSLARAYSTDSLGRFTEDGSFIGQYNTGTARRGMPRDQTYM